jgi:MoxR-like ATPase
MGESVNIRELNDLIASKSNFVSMIQQGMDQTIVGQKHLVDSLLIALLANGHVLLEGVPGLAKTLAIKTLSQLIDAKFSRIQFTPDLLPADVVGTMVYSVQKEKFETKKGPVFANFVLADEINRAPAKVQSALLEAMQERQVTIGDQTFALDDPFLVLATQNPIEQEGTYPLPEAQVDRFLMKVVIGYPNKEEEKQIVRMNISPSHPNIQPLVSPRDIIETRDVVNKIYIDEKIERYIVDIVFATRFPDDYRLSDLKSIISFGASPRASISMALAARAYAFLRGRGYVIPEDVRAVCHDVMRHRLGLSYEAEANNISADEVISEILDKVAVP